MNKNTKKNFRSFYFFLSCLILFQSCYAYHKVPVNLEEAVKEGKRAKIKTTDNQNYVYKAIVYEDSKFFGLKKIKGKSTKIFIDDTSIQSIRLENKSLSSVLSVGLILATIGAIILIEFAISFDMWGNSGFSDAYCCGL